MTAARMRKAALCRLLRVAFLVALVEAGTETAELRASPTSDGLVAQATRLGLAGHDQWAALLHVRAGSPSVRDAGFLLSQPNFSLTGELEATIRFLFDGPAANVCRFPARYTWLQSHLAGPELPVDRCGELTEFRDRAPSEAVTLVFASENLAQPSSTMGHLFLKLAGENRSGTQVQHAVSFFTDGTTWNVPKLFFDSVVVGMDGYFTLEPYQLKLNQYLLAEQRSVWEYELGLSEFQRRLVHDHLFELKQTTLTYFFQRYNCATVINFVLSVATGTNRAFDAGFWVTPRDVVKRAGALGVVASTTLVSPSRWLVRALREQVSRPVARQVKADVEQRAPLRAAVAPSEDFVRLELAKAYHAYRLRNESVNLHDTTYAEDLNRASDRYANVLALRPDRRRNPLATPHDSQFESGVLFREARPYARMTFLPGSHRLEDDNRQYLSESELALLDVSVLKSLTGPAFELERLMVYSAKSLVPYDTMSRGMSGQLQLGVEQQLDDQLHRRRVAVASGGIGRTLRVATDIDVFALIGSGVTFHGWRAGVFAKPEIGVIVREVFGMKTTATVATVASAERRRGTRHALRATQSKYIANGRWSLHAAFELHMAGTRRLRQFDTSVKRLF